MKGTRRKAKKKMRWPDAKSWAGPVAVKDQDGVVIKTMPAKGTKAFRG